MSFDDGIERLRANARLRRLAEFALPLRTFAVGGCVRDAALGRPTKDLDIVIREDGERVAAAAAMALPARLVRLGRERFAALRLVDAEGWIDLWDLRGGDLDTDLWRRDLTIHAIAVDCLDGTVRDPTGGRADLERRCLRATRAEVFREDPLRVLRLVRFAVTLPGFSVDPATAAAARSAAPRITEVAAERVRDELDRILSRVELSVALQALLDAGLVPPLFGPEAEAPLREAALRHAGGPSIPPAKAALFENDETMRLPLQWARVACAIHPDPGSAGAFLSGLARQGLMTGAVRDLAAALLQPAWSAPVGVSEARLWLHRAGNSWADAIALRADLARTDPERAAWNELRGWIRDLTDAERTAIVAPRPFLDGAAVQQRFGIGPGPEVGEALAALRRAQVLGTVVDRAAAEKLLDSLRCRLRDS